MNRAKIDELKKNLEGTRCLDKFYDIINCVIGNHADAYAWDFNTDIDSLAIALEEILFKITYSDEELAEMESDEE